MSACLLALAIAAGCVGSPVPGPAPSATADSALDPTLDATPTVADQWVAEDKLRHFTLSFAATQMSYGGLRVAVDHDAAFTGAVVTGLALGLAKEVHDVRLGRRFSLKDLVWDAAGVALAALLVQQIDGP